MLNRIFLFGNFQSFLWLASAFGFASSWLRGFPVAFAFWAFVVSFKRHRFSASPSCLWCPLEFLAVAFGPYLFGSDLLAFVALKVLSNNHLHLLVIRFAFVVFSFPLSDFPSRFCCLLDFKVLFSTDSHQLGFADASFRFVPLQRLHLRTCQTVVFTAAPHS